VLLNGQAEQKIIPPQSQSGIAATQRNHPLPPLSRGREGVGERGDNF